MPSSWSAGSYEYYIVERDTGVELLDRRRVLGMPWPMRADSRKRVIRISPALERRQPRPFRLGAAAE